MTSTSTRTLLLLSLLQNRRYWSGTALADRLGVSARTLRRDVDRLREMGYPVEARRGVDGGYQLAAGVALPPLVLEDDEAIALAVGLQSAVQAGSVVGIEESSLRALSKIVQVMPKRLRRQVDALAAVTVPVVIGSDGPSVDPTALATIAQGCRDCERIRFRYRARAGDPTERHVDPYRLVLLGRRWYLVAFDLERFDWRTFRLDRLSDPQGTGAHFPLRELPRGDAAQFVRDGIESQPFRHAIEVVIHAEAPVVRGRIGRWAAIEDLGDGRCLARMSAESLDWPIMALSATEAEFQVLSPPELIVHIEERMGRFDRSIHPGRGSGSRRPASAS